MRNVNIFRLNLSLALCFALALVCCGRAAAQADYTPINVENGGTITGNVKWTGPAPKLTRLPVTKNVDVCDPQMQKTRDLERLEITPDGNGAPTVDVLRAKETRAKPGDCHGPAKPPDMRTCRFIPHILLMA